MNDNELDEFIDLAYDELEEKQANIMKEFQLDNADSFEYELENTKLLFKKDGEVYVEASFTPIGVYTRQDEIWLWSWADEELPANLIDKSFELKFAMTQKHIEYGNYSAFESDEETSMELAAVACKLLDAKGIYRAVEGDNDFFMTIDTITEI